MTDWLKASALDMAAGLRSKAISATELLNVYISRMESVNPAVNALAVERFDEARVEARMADEAWLKPHLMIRFLPFSECPVPSKNSWPVLACPIRQVYSVAKMLWRPKMPRPWHA